MSTSKSTRRTILTDDGELREVNDDPQDQPASSSEVAYCTHCGTANPADSNFCRKCGNSLVDQDAQMIGIPSRQPSVMKAKNDAAQQNWDMVHQIGRSASTFPSAVVELFTMIFVAGMAITAISTEDGRSSWVAIIALGAWFLVEVVRRTGHRAVSVGSALVDVLTMIFVTGMVITATVTTSSAWMGAVILLAWFLMESVRAYIPHHN